VVEVTSPGTRATDRREKLDTYRRIPSLSMYLIVEQRRRHVLAYISGTRRANGREKSSTVRVRSCSPP
jgi:Uma2 family endonuclease